MGRPTDNTNARRWPDRERTRRERRRQLLGHGSLSHAMGGELYDAGYTHGGTTALTTYLRRLDPASGTVLWKQRLWTDEQDWVPEQVEK